MPFIACLGFVSLGRLPQSEGTEGIICHVTPGRRVNVTKEQWLRVRKAFFDHDVKQIAPFISEKGILVTRMWGFDRARKPNFHVSSKFLSKETFLKNVANTKIVDGGYGFEPPDYVYPLFWVSLRKVTLHGEVKTIQPEKSFHTRSDVWCSCDTNTGGRLRFVCEKGWLKVAEIKAFVPPDP